MKLGIHQKVLTVLAGVLVLNTLLGTLLASYYTNRQNEEAAFAALGNDLVAWQSDLATATTQLKQVALATVSDMVVLTQLADLMTVEDIVADPARVDDRPQMLASMGYRKTASLNRLELALRTGRFSSIAVHSHRRLSHFVSASEVGMALQRAADQWAWVGAPVNARGDIPFSSWPAWPESKPPVAALAHHATPAATEVSFLFEPGQDAAVQIAVPVQGLVGTAVMTDQQRHPIARLYAHPRVAGLPNAAPPALNAVDMRSMVPEVFAVVVFRKHIDRSVLEDFAKRSGKLPALFSPDGQYRQSLAPAAAFTPSMVHPAAGAAGEPATLVQRRTVQVGPQSFYTALLPWRFEAQTRLILGLATPRDLTLQNVRQTVFAILGASTAVLLLSLGVGQWWVRRYTSPIVQLTASVKAVSAANRLQPGGASSAALPSPHAPHPTPHPTLPATLRPADMAAPDEVGELARAFNAMVAELQRAFDTLEQQVQARTAELRQQERYLRTLIDMLPMWAWFKDAQSRYLVVNALLARDCGRSVAEMTGKFDAELFDMPVAEERRAADADTMRTRTGWSAEQQVVGPGAEHGAEPGAATWRETYLAPVIDEDGSVLGTVGVARDISDRKAVEAARETALTEARRLAMQRSGFLAQMSHELRTPLNGILGFAQILRLEPDLPEQQARGLAIIEESGRHLLDLITDILDMARIDAGRLELYPEDFDLQALLQAVGDLVSLQAKGKRLRFCFEAADDLPTLVRLDQQRLRQVLLNLLSNAIKFSETGAVTLRVQRAQQAQQAPEADADADAMVRLHFEVQDTGIGLTPAQTERLFRPFEQLGEHQHRAAGSGLGLVISQQLVRLMGGEITVHSQPGVGSRFGFEIETSIPRQPRAAPPPPDRLPTGYAGRRRRVLVADDVAPNRAVIMGMLEGLGFELAEAADGEQALEVAARWQPDLVVMDLMMPVMDGYEAIRRLRQQTAAGHLPIIAASASATPQAERDSLEAGADTFITKPIQRQALIDALGKTLGLTWLR